MFDSVIDFFEKAVANEAFAFLPISLVQTLHMIVPASFLATLIGIPMAVILVITRPGHIMPSPVLNAVLSAIVNVTRSIPFNILAVTMIPLTRFVVGTAIEAEGMILPLTVATTPFIARLVETVLLEIDRGLLEAAQAMGASRMQMIWKVMLPEALSGIISCVTVAVITLISFSSIAGMFGGGGLGDMAIRFGYKRYMPDIMWTIIILLIIIVQLVQIFGDRLAARFDYQNIRRRKQKE